MNTPLVQPYLNFSGRCEEAIAYYAAHLGAEQQMLMRFRESPDAPPTPLPEGWGEKVMHCAFRIGESVLMASDGCGDPDGFKGIMLSLTMPDEAAARRAFDALADGGEVFMPMGATFWSPCFGMVHDRFGLGWMVTVPEVLVEVAP